MRRFCNTRLITVTLAALGLAGPAGAAERANDFPTSDRVEFVLECMNRHGGEQHFIYKCSCMIDELAKRYKYDDYVEASAVARYSTMGGERMGEFRDSDEMKGQAKSYRGNYAAAAKTCGLGK